MSLPWNATQADVDAFAAAYAAWPPGWPRAADPIDDRRLTGPSISTTRPPRPATPRGRGDAALVHRAVRQPAQRRARMGQDAEAAVEAARAQVAALIGAEPREIVFTSGATESNNIAIKGAARYALAQGDARRRVITVATEHKCVLDSVADLAAEGFEPVVLPVRPTGCSTRTFCARPADARRCWSASWRPTTRPACSRTSPPWPPLARAAGALFHTDAAQAAGKVAARRGGRSICLAQRPQALRAQGRRRAVCPPPPARAAGAAVLRRRAGARPALGHPADAAAGRASARPAASPRRRWRRRRAPGASARPAAGRLRRPARPARERLMPHALPGNLNLTFRRLRRWR